MVNLGCDYVFLFVPIKLCDTLKCHVITLSGSTGENDLFTLGSDDSSNVLSGVLASLFSIPAELMRF